MAVSATVDVQGLREALREVGQVDKALRRQVGRELRSSVAPLRSAAQSLLPASPLSGWTSGRYAYSQGGARSGVRVDIGGRTRTTSYLGGDTTVIPLLTMTQRDAGGAVFDMAGRRSSGNSPQGAAFIRGLNRSGRASRSMWKAAEGGIPRIERDVVAAIGSVERQINARLAT